MMRTFAGVCSSVVALLLYLVGAATPASAAAGGTIAGTVSATPGKYLEETVVYLKSAPGRRAPETVDMDQKQLRFVPHVLAIQAGDTVAFLNHDTVPHNVFSPEGGYNLGIFGPGESRSHTFDKPGVYAQLCNLHPEMLAYVFVGKSAYAAVVHASGRFTIADVPPGAYDLAVWNSHLKAPARRVTVAAGATAEASFALHR